MATYSLASYTTGDSDLASYLHLRNEDIIYFNATAEIGKPACFLAVNHETKEYSLNVRLTVGSLQVFVEQLKRLKYFAILSSSPLL